MRKHLRIIPAIAILVAATACAGGPTEPMTDDVLTSDEVEETAGVDQQTQDESPELRRNLYLARARR